MKWINHSRNVKACGFSSGCVMLRWNKGLTVTEVKRKWSDMEMEAKKKPHIPSQALHGDNWRRTGGGGGLESRPKNSRNNWRGGTDRWRWCRSVSGPPRHRQRPTARHIRDSTPPTSDAFTDTPVAEGTLCMFMLEIYCINALKLIYTYHVFFYPW